MFRVIGYFIFILLASNLWASESRKAVEVSESSDSIILDVQTPSGYFAKHELNDFPGIIKATVLFSESYKHRNYPAVVSFVFELQNSPDSIWVSIVSLPNENLFVDIARRAKGSPPVPISSINLNVGNETSIELDWKDPGSLKIVLHEIKKVEALVIPEEFVIENVEVRFQSLKGKVNLSKPNKRMQSDLQKATPFVDA